MKTTNKQEPVYNRPKCVFKVIAMPEYYIAVIKPVDSDDIYFISSLKVKGKQLSGANARTFVNNHQMVGFGNRRVDDFLLHAILYNSSVSDVYKMYNKLITSDIPTFKWEVKPKSLYGTYDIKGAFTKNNSGELDELASIYGLKVESFDDEQLSHKTPSEVKEYLLNSIAIIDTLFADDKIQGSYRQNKAMINKYIQGADWAISQTPAALAERALTGGSRKFITKKEKFTWTLSGENLLTLIPENWSNELKSYSDRYEEAFAAFKKAVAGGMSEREAGNTILKRVPGPVIEPIRVGKHLEFRPSMGGAHSSFVNDEGVRVTSRATNIKHRDIQGAYGALAILTNQFGEVTERYKSFVVDKFEAKHMKALVAELDKTTTDVSILNKEFNLNFNTWDYEAISSLVLNEVASTKLATNSPTGKSDEPGSFLYNPIAVVENRFTLQILLYLAIKDVLSNSEENEVYSVNTDGLFYDGDETVLAPIFDAWAEKWGLSLDFEEVGTYIGKDDNSRLILDENGEIEEASGDISHTDVNPFKRGNLPKIVDYAVIDKLKDESSSFEDIIDKYINEGRVDLFATTLKATKNHKTAINLKIAQRVNRVLLSTEGDSVINYSVIKDKGEAWSGIPESKFILINNEFPESLPASLNKQAYIDMVEKSYSNWF